MRRGMIAVTALILLLFAGVTAFWAMTARSMRGAFEHWAADMRAKNWRVTYAAPERGGWPWRASLTIPDFSLSGGQLALPGGMAWHTDRVILDIELSRPHRLWVAPAGQQTLRLSHAPDLVFQAEQMRGWVRLGRRRPNRIELSCTAISGGLAGSMHPEDLRIGTLSFRLELPAPQADHTEERLFVEANSIGLPDKGRWPLGATIGHFTTSLHLVSPPIAGRSPAEQAHAWREGGGRLDLESLSLHWGPLTLDGHASIGLDERLQPAGSGQAHIAGTGAALDALASGGVLPPGLAGTAKAVLGVTGDSPLDLPFEVRDSTVSIAKIPLAHLADIAWPKA